MVNFHKTLLISMLIVFLSLANFNEVPTPEIFLFKNADKLIHFIMYFTLSLVFMLEFYYSHQNTVTRRKMFYINLIPLAMSIAFEIIQEYLTKTRSGSYVDEIFNMLGILFAMMAFNFIRKSGIVKFLIKFPFKA